MKIAIVRSRNYPNLKLVREYIEFLPDDTEIVSGGARGVDTTAKFTALRLKMSYREFPANWNLYGRKAGFIRNVELVKYSDGVAAFWDNESRGTLSTIRLANQYHKRLTVFGPNGEVISEFVTRWF